MNISVPNTIHFITNISEPLFIWHFYCNVWTIYVCAEYFSDFISWTLRSFLIKSLPCFSNTDFQIIVAFYNLIFDITINVMEVSTPRSKDIDRVLNKIVPERVPMVWFNYLAKNCVIMNTFRFLSTNPYLLFCLNVFFHNKINR